MTELPPAAAVSGGPEALTSELIERRLAAARGEPHAVPGEWLSIDVDAPVAAADALLSHFPEHDVVLWSPARGPEYAGVGVAAVLDGTGASRFEEVRARAQALWARSRGLSAPPGDELGPRLFGGFSFNAGGASTPAWEQFGPARFVLPRVLYAQDGQRAQLSLLVQRSELASGAVPEHVRTAQRVLDVLGERQKGAAPAHASEPLERNAISREAFRAHVEDLVESIRAGRLRKVVAAQELRLSFERALDAVETAIALRDEAPGCTRFLFRFGDSSFVGATPETLLGKRGLALSTEALAGSIGVGAERPEVRLQGSSKELEEHRFVVASIRAALEPLCTECSLPDAPEIRRLKHLLHLRTPISARLRRPTHVLELIERLHPTPAVGGVPTPEAVAWIASHEPFDRGWYAGAVGWFDAAGDGDFNVALRSGLLAGRHARLYAGAGIVGASVPDDEYEETNLKLVALLAALRSR